MNRIFLMVWLFLLLPIHGVLAQVKDGDWTYLTTGQNFLGVEYRTDGTVFYNGELLMNCPVDAENKITISNPSKIKGLSIVHCLQALDESSAFIIDTKNKKKITNDIVPKRWRMDSWFSWSPNENYLVLSPRGEVTNGDMFFVDLKIGRTTEIHFKDFTNKNPLQAQEFLGSSFSWITATTYKLKLVVFCNIYEMDEGKCDQEKILGSYDAQVNVATLAITYGLPKSTITKTLPQKKNVVKKNPNAISSTQQKTSKKTDVLTFTINRECGWGADAGCKLEIVTFSYNSSLEISVFIGDKVGTPSLTISKGKETTGYFYHENPFPHFLQEDKESESRQDWNHRNSSEKTVDEELSKHLLAVYRLADTIAFSDQNTNNKKYTETNKFNVLKELRLYLLDKTTNYSTSSKPIRKVDFRNFEFTLSGVDADVFEKQNIKVKIGKYSTKTRESYGVWEEFTVGKIIYGDLTGDGSEEAIIDTATTLIGGSPASFTTHAYYVYGIENGSAKFLTRLDIDTDYFSFRDDNDECDESLTVKSAKIENGLLVLNAVSSGLRCSGVGYNVLLKYKWNGEKLGLTENPIRKKTGIIQSSTQTQKSNSIRQVDFRNFTYNLNSRDENETPIFKDYIVKKGKWEDAKPKYGGPIWWINIGKILYGDLNGDSEEDALVEVLSQNNYGSNGWQLENREYLIFTMSNGNLSKISSFDDSNIAEFYKPFEAQFDNDCEGVLISTPKAILKLSGKDVIQFESVKIWTDQCSGKKVQILINIINGKPIMIGQPKLSK